MKRLTPSERLRILEVAMALLPLDEPTIDRWVRELRSIRRVLDGKKPAKGKAKR